MKEIGHYVRNRPENLVWCSVESPIRKATYADTSNELFNEVVAEIYIKVVGDTMFNAISNSLKDSALQTLNL